MKLLLTSASIRLTRHLADALSVSHEILLTDISSVSTRHPFVQSDLGHDESTNDLVRGVDVIVHSGSVDSDASVSEQLDYQTRCTYNLLWAAWEERVPRVVYLSSLGVMDKYDKGYYVTEQWRPLPVAEPPALTFHLSEMVCKEFAREHKLQAVCLRLGDLIWDQGHSHESALFPDDAVQAVEKALTVEIENWAVFNIHSGVTNNRFSTAKAEKLLGFTPSSAVGGSR
jgi:nucleoside-diphosphate-sugar epimerase